MTRLSLGLSARTIRGIGLALFLAASAGAAAAGPIDARHGHGGMPCGDRDAILDHLRAAYDETPVAIGLDARGRVVEILAAESGSWTMLVTLPNGLSCLAGSGDAFEMIAPSSDDPVA